MEEGFLAAPNRHKLDFALMWASQTWMDVHPAVGPGVGYGNRTPTFNGQINRPTFDAMTDHIISRYFSQPNYLRAVTQGAPPRGVADPCGPNWVRTTRLLAEPTQPPARRDRRGALQRGGGDPLAA